MWRWAVLGVSGDDLNAGVCRMRRIGVHGALSDLLPIRTNLRRGLLLLLVVSRVADLVGAAIGLFVPRCRTPGGMRIQLLHEPPNVARHIRLRGVIRQGPVSHARSLPPLLSSPRVQVRGARRPTPTPPPPPGPSHWPLAPHCGSTAAYTTNVLQPPFTFCAVFFSGDTTAEVAARRRRQEPDHYSSPCPEPKTTVR